MNGKPFVHLHDVSWLGIWLCLAMPGMADSKTTKPPGSSAEQVVESVTTQRLEHQTFRAEHWGLEASEWLRYQSLKQGIRGSVSAAILSPIEVLGIHARNDDERRRYAERWAVMMRDDAERILAFQRAYDEAQRRLYPGGVLIDTHAASLSLAKPRPQQKLVWQPEDRVLFFTDTQCPACDAVLERLISKLTQFSGIDVFLIDVAAGEESRIRAWAASKHINPQWVSQHKITLNVDAGALGQVSGLTPKQDEGLPVLMLRREGQLNPLPVSRF